MNSMLGRTRILPKRLSMKLLTNATHNLNCVTWQCHLRFSCCWHEGRSGRRKGSEGREIVTELWGEEVVDGQGARARAREGGAYSPRMTQLGFTFHRVFFIARFTFSPASLRSSFPTSVRPWVSYRPSFLSLDASSLSVYLVISLSAKLSHLAARKWCPPINVTPIFGDSFLSITLSVKRIRILYLASSVNLQNEIFKSKYSKK